MKLSQERADRLIETLVSRGTSRHPWAVETRPGDLEADAQGCTLLAAVWYDRGVTAQDVLRADSSVVTRVRIEMRHDARDGSFAMRTSELVRGRARARVLRADGKTWARWRVRETIRLREMPDGRVLQTVRRSGWYSSGYVYAAELGVAAPRELGLLLDRPLPIFDEVNPLARAYAVTSDTPNAFAQHFVGARDVPELTRRLFGKRAYRKDLARAVAAVGSGDMTQAGRLTTAWLFRGLVPVDWLVLHLNGRGPYVPADGLSPIGLRRLRRLLRAMDDRSLRRLLLGNEPRVDRWDLRDTSGHFADAVDAPRRIDSWSDLHDYVFAQAAGAQQLESARRSAAFRKAEKNDFRIEHKPEHLALEGRTAGAQEIVLARDGSTLQAWGEQMRHCIGTYKMTMFSGRSLLGAVLRDGELVANFEVGIEDDRMVLTQLRGRHNAPVPEPYRSDVMEHLSAAGVRSPGCLAPHAAFPFAPRAQLGDVA